MCGIWTIWILSGAYKKNLILDKIIGLKKNSTYTYTGRLIRTASAILIQTLFCRVVYIFTGTEKTGEQSESPTSVQDARRKKSSMVHLWRPRTWWRSNNWCHKNASKNKMRTTRKAISIYLVLLRSAPRLGDRLRGVTLPFSSTQGKRAVWKSELPNIKFDLNRNEGKFICKNQ